MEVDRERERIQINSAKCHTFCTRAFYAITFMNSLFNFNFTYVHLLTNSYTIEGS